MDGSTNNVVSKATKNEDAIVGPTYDDYEDMKEPTPFPVYYVDDDIGSTTHPIYDMDDDTCMIVPKDDELGVDALEHDEHIAWDELPLSMISFLRRNIMKGLM